jgi:hypothetical protein
MAIILARLEDEWTHALRETENLAALESVIVRALQSDRSFPVVTRIDPYGDTVLDNSQMRRFLDEWAEVQSFVQDDREAQAWRQVDELAFECFQNPSCHLRFCSD